MSRAPTLLLVDDEPVNLKVLRNVLQSQYRLLYAKDGHTAITLAIEHQPDLILLDVMMPALTGFEVCKALKLDATTQAIPVIFVTALGDETDESTGFEVGGVDYIVKPISPATVLARVKTHLSLVQADALKRTQLEVFAKLARAAEYKDEDTGLHVIRMSHYSYILAKAYGLSDVEADEILHAAPMHDVGKIGIPDAILQKPGKLTPQEFDEMRTHTEIGAKILGNADSSLLHIAKTVALTHHEKWDGSGYPKGLKGEDIPLVGRIVAVADVFDALTSKRPYKEAWSIEEAMHFMVEQKGKHFDAKIVDCLEACIEDIIAIKRKYAN